jgi:non-heme chloroperoxidase
MRIREFGPALFLVLAAMHTAMSAHALPGAMASSPGADFMSESQAPERVTVEGIELHYLASGEGEPLVLIHGSLADYRYWLSSRQVEPLADRYRVIAYSRRHNHPNRNVLSPAHSALVEAGDLLLLLDRLGLERVLLVGHSYGAYTALLFALEHPQRVKALVLAEAPILSWLPDIEGGEGIEEGFMESVWTPLGAAFVAGDDSGLDFTARWYFGVPFTEIEPMWQGLFHDNVREWRALALSPEAFPKIDYERVRALHIPTLLLSGGKNAGGFNDLVDGHLASLLPQVERLVIPEASHEMFLDFPEVTARAMREFFQRHD